MGEGARLEALATCLDTEVVLYMMEAERKAGMRPATADATARTASWEPVKQRRAWAYSGVGSRL